MFLDQDAAKSDYQERLMERWEANQAALRRSVRSLTSMWGIFYLADDILSEVFLDLYTDPHEKAPVLFDYGFVRYCKRMIYLEVREAMRKERGATYVGGEERLLGRMKLDTLNALMEEGHDMSRIMFHSHGIVEWCAVPDAVLVDQPGKLEMLVGLLVEKYGHDRPGSHTWRLAWICDRLLTAAKADLDVPTVTQLVDELNEMMSSSLSVSLVHKDMRKIRNEIRPGVYRKKAI